MTKITCNIDISREEREAYLEQIEKKYPGCHIDELELTIDGKNVDCVVWFSAVKFQRIRRITGYLVGTLDRFNNAKRKEVEDRVKHGTGGKTMKFEEALKAMREGKKVKRNGSEFCYYMKNNDLYHESSDGYKERLDDSWCRLSIKAVLADNWVIAVEESKADKTDIKITFIGGGEIVIPDEQWDDYRYDGKFFTIIKGGADIAMYNAKEVFSLVLVRQGEG